MILLFMILPQSICLNQAINEACDEEKGDIELLELIAKDPQAFILKQGWASVSRDVSRGLMVLLFWKMV